MLPTSLLPTSRPILALLGMDEHQFHELYIGSDDEQDVPLDGHGFDEMDMSVIEALSDLVDERAEALMPEWRHRQATTDIVECFAPIAKDIAELDMALKAVSGWLCGIGGRIDLRSAGCEYQAAEIRMGRALQAFDDLVLDPEGDTEFDDQGNVVRRLAAADMPIVHERDAAIDAAAPIAVRNTLHVVFGDVYVVIALLADRIRVVVDLPTLGEIDMGGHRYDGDEDADPTPTTPPLVVA